MVMGDSGTGDLFVPVCSGPIISAFTQCPELIGRHMRYVPVNAFRANLAVIGYPGNAPGALFGGDDQYALGSPGTINGCGRTVFQHFYAGDIVGVYRIEVSADLAVYYYQRLGIGAQGGKASQADAEGLVRVAAGFGYGQACYFTLQQLSHIAYVALVKLFSLYAGNGAGHFSFFLGTITYYHYFGEVTYRFGQVYGNSVLAANGYFLCLEADGGDHQHRVVVWHGYGKFAAYIGGGTGTGAFDLYAGARYRVIACGGDGTGYFSLGHEPGKRNKKDQETKLQRTQRNDFGVYIIHNRGFACVWLIA